MTGAQSLTLALGGAWHGHYGTAPCPLCQPRAAKGQNALTLGTGTTGRLLLHCKKSDCGFAEILAAAGSIDQRHLTRDSASCSQRYVSPLRSAKQRANQARCIWQEAKPIAGTIAASYLRQRGITCALPKTLRHHAACWHGPTAKRHPAMLAWVDGAEGYAVHRTFLRVDGRGKADLNPAKLMLGATAGGAVRLTGGEGPLVIAEGIETALSLASGLLDGPATVWAALSTSGMRGLSLPAVPDHLIVAADGDPAGRAAAQALAARAHALGWQVSLLPAPNGHDWNDILTTKGLAR